MTEREITPSHCFRRMAGVLETLELVRLEMGRPPDPRRDLRVENAEPRECFFQARAMLHKAHRLHTELTGAQPVVDLGTAVPALRPADVLVLIDRTVWLLERIKLQMGIDEAVSEDPFIPDKQPSDVLWAVLRASRQLNLLLSRPFSPADALERIAEALARTETLLGLVGASLPPLPRHERRKTPADVYRALWPSFITLGEILQDAGLSTLDVRQMFAGEEPSDVYDLASLVISELVHLQLQVMGTDAIDSRPRGDFPSPVLPAHCHRRGRQLHAALIQLRDLAREQPGRLGPRH